MFMGLLLSLLIGLFFLIGILIVKYTKKRDKMSLFAISLAFVVMLGLLVFDLLPELINQNNILLIIPLMGGLLLFIVLDKIFPYHHEHDHHEHNLHLNHIGLITILALCIHNLIEGFTLYNITINDSLAGFLMMVSISLHNIPLGFQIGSQIENNKKSYIFIFLLCTSALIGSLVYILFGNISESLTSILLSITFGMLLYILIFELFNEIKTSFKKKEVIYGIILGVIIIIITFML